MRSAEHKTLTPPLAETLRAVLRVHETRGTGVLSLDSGEPGRLLELAVRKGVVVDVHGATLVGEGPDWFWAPEANLMAQLGRAVQGGQPYGEAVETVCTTLIERMASLFARGVQAGWAARTELASAGFPLPQDLLQLATQALRRGRPARQVAWELREMLDRMVIREELGIMDGLDSIAARTLGLVDSRSTLREVILRSGRGRLERSEWAWRSIDLLLGLGLVRIDGRRQRSTSPPEELDDTWVIPNASGVPELVAPRTPAAPPPAAPAPEPPPPDDPTEAELAFAMPDDETGDHAAFALPDDDELSDVAAFAMPADEPSDVAAFAMPADEPSDVAAFAMPADELSDVAPFAMPDDDEPSDVAAFAMPADETGDHAAFALPDDDDIDDDIAFAMPNDEPDEATDDEDATDLYDAPPMALLEGSDLLEDIKNGGDSAPLSGLAAFLASQGDDEDEGEWIEAGAHEGQWAEQDVTRSTVPLTALERMRSLAERLERANPLARLAIPVDHWPTSDDVADAYDHRILEFHADRWASAGPEAKELAARCRRCLQGAVKALSTPSKVAEHYGRRRAETSPAFDPYQLPRGS